MDLRARKSQHGLEQQLEARRRKPCTRDASSLVLWTGDVSHRQRRMLVLKSPVEVARVYVSACACLQRARCLHTSRLTLKLPTQNNGLQEMLHAQVPGHHEFYFLAAEPFHGDLCHRGNGEMEPSVRTHKVRAYASHGNEAVSH